MPQQCSDMLTSRQEPLTLTTMASVERLTEARLPRVQFRCHSLCEPLHEKRGWVGEIREGY